VLLVSLDTTRAGALSAYGHPKPTSPQIDRLAREGTLFARAYATDFWTLPSHASMLTGLYPSEHGASSETNRLPDNVATLAEQLSRAGYRTGGFVSNAWLSAERGFARGFERYEEAWRLIASGSGGYALDRRVVSGATEWMTSAQDDRPFFAFINLNSAHLPYSPDPLVLLDFAPGPRPIERVARLRQTKGVWRYIGGAESYDALDFEILNELYQAEIAMVDALVGRLIEALEQQGVLDDTLVIVTSDHGENVGDHEMIDHVLSMYETTLHIPLIFRHPKHFEAGRTEQALVSLVDIVPTVLDVAGLGKQHPEAVRRSLARSDRAKHRFVIAENERPVNGVEIMQRMFPDFDVTTIDQTMRALRTERYKLIWRSDGSMQLFDLDADPGELNDIAQASPEIRDELHALLMRWMREHEQAHTAPAFETRDPEALRQLEALGYIE
jgi:arylsulfatase A-like enzyme